MWAQVLLGLDNLRLVSRGTTDCIHLGFCRKLSLISKRVSYRFLSCLIKTYRKSEVLIARDELRQQMTGNDNADSGLNFV